MCNDCHHCNSINPTICATFLCSNINYLELKLRPTVKHKLSVYTQNMFLACGYDTSDVVAEMDVSQSAESEWY